MEIFLALLILASKVFLKLFLFNGSFPLFLYEVLRIFLKSLIFIDLLEDFLTSFLMDFFHPNHSKLSVLFSATSSVGKALVFLVSFSTETFLTGAGVSLEESESSEYSDSDSDVSSTFAGFAFFLLKAPPLPLVES